MELPRQLWLPSRCSHGVSFRFPLTFLVPVTTVAVFTILIIAIRSLAAFMPTPPNPFAAYANIFPTQPASALEAKGASCPATSSGVYHPPDPDSCDFWPLTGPFSHIHVLVSDEVIQKIDFVMRGDTLRVGDLTAMWGQPDVNVWRNATLYHWTNSGIRASVIMIRKRHSLWSPVYIVYMPELS